MILDNNAEFGSALDFANEPGTALVGDVLDLGTSGRSLGAGRPVYWVIQITTAADGGATNTGTTRFQLVSDAQAALAADGTETVHVQTDDFLFGQLTAGTELFIPIPSGIVFERYVGVQIVQGTEGEDDCVGNSFLVLDDGEYTVYGDAVN